MLATSLFLWPQGAEQAQANVICEAASGAVGGIADGVPIIGGAIGGGNPVGDACDSVTDDVVGAATAPVRGALKGIGSGIFDQIGAWVSDGAAWLMGRVVRLIDKTTSPDLTDGGFLRQYRKMAEIALVLAAAMLLLAVLEGLARGNVGMLARIVFVNVPLAFIGASVAFVVVQLLLGVTDALSHAISASAGRDGERFFEEAIKSLGAVGGTTGETAGSTGASPVGEAAGQASGSIGVPLFVTFLAAAIGAFAAFFLWIELLMRDAAVYAVSPFMPLALAASIWPRWSGVLHRTGELIFVVITSKFVIVAIISLAASLLVDNAGEVEQILAASALMLLACFAPLGLLRFVSFAQGAMAAAYGRRSASASAMNGTQSVYRQAQMVRGMARANWGGGSAATAPRPGGAGRSGEGGASPRGDGGGTGPSPAGPGSGAAGGAGKTAAGGAGAGAAPAGAAAAGTVGAAQAATRRLTQSASAEAGGEGAAQRSPQTAKPGAKAPPPAVEGPSAPRSDAPEPREARGGNVPGAGEHPPRPAAEPRDATRKGKDGDE